MKACSLLASWGSRKPRPCGDASALRCAAGDQADVAHILSNRSRLALYTGANARARALQDS